MQPTFFPRLFRDLRDSVALCARISCVHNSTCNLREVAKSTGTAILAEMALPHSHQTGKGLPPRFVSNGGSLQEQRPYLPLCVERLIIGCTVYRISVWNSERCTVSAIQATSNVSPLSCGIPRSYKPAWRIRLTDCAAQVWRY